MLKDLFVRGRNFGLGLCLVVNIGCEETPIESEPSITEQDMTEQIVSNYYDWARHSKNKNYYGMIDLVAPQSNFKGATNVCKDAWDQGGDFYYEFSSVDVQYTQKQPPDAAVYGNWLRYQRWPGEEPIVQEGGFYSSSYPADGEFYGDEWKLDGINMNSDKNWWK